MDELIKQNSSSVYYSEISRRAYCQSNKINQTEIFSPGNGKSSSDELLNAILVLLSMKSRAYSIFFLLILILYLLRPVTPFIEYALNKEYIAKNLCINRNKPKSCCEGKCHLKKQLAKSDPANDSEGNNNTKKTQQKNLDEFVKSQGNACSVFETDQNSEFFPKIIITDHFPAVIFVPPQSFTTFLTV